MNSILKQFLNICFQLNTERMADKLKPYRLLPKEFQVKGADCHLYRIGLTFFEPVSNKSRNRFHNPLIVFLFAIQLFIHQMIIVVLPQNSHKIHLYFGDIGYFIGAQIPLGQSYALIGLLAVFSQICNFYNHKRGIKPNDLRVFQMMVGVGTPKSLGLTDSVIVVELLENTRRVLKLTRFICSKVKYFIFLITAIVIYTKVAKEDQLYVVPYIIIWPLLIQYSLNIIIYQFVYYYLITHYLFAKNKIFNKKLKDIIDMCRNDKSMVPNMAYIMRESNQIYSEIDEYNCKYWCKFLGALWVIISTEIASMTYLTFYGNTNLVLKTLFGCLNGLFIFILVFIVRISASVYNSVDGSYVLLNSMYTSIEMNEITMKFKVNHLKIFNLL